MSTLNQVVEILDTTLQLGDRAAELTAESALLGAVPEFDSMAVVSVLTALEEYFGIMVDDDDITAETFETVGTLTEFVDQQINA